MKKIYLLAAVALVALASCTSDEFVGDNGSPNTGANGEKAISFGSSTGKITRATTNDPSKSDAEKLDKQFKVYGVKSGTTAGNFQKVFVEYGVWATENTTTTSNSHNWEYVEPNTSAVTHGSTDNPMNISNQTIKYWDHSATDYRFVAGSPYKAFTFGVNATTNAIETATVTGFAGHVNLGDNTKSAQPIYIAQPLIIPETGYATGYGTAPVTFNFVRQQSRVRVGIFETIPGYKIKEIEFYPHETSAWGTTPSDNIVLASTTADYFQGGNADAVVGTISYNWTTTPASYSFEYKAAPNKTLTKAQNWYGGAYNFAAADPNPAWEMAITSSETNINKLYGKDDDMETTTGYFTVLPTSANASPLLIKCDYILESEVDNSGETIKVYGATAAIPAAFCKWAPNTSYTYLFKISDNTNGKTNPEKETVGLFPITFDAVAIAEDNAEVGYITTVSTPSITTYQEGSVIASGIEYVISKAITVTVTNDATGAVLSINGDTAGEGYIQVYYLGTTAMTEADLQLNPPTTGALGISITDDVLSFTPTSAGYYAVRYQTSTSPVAYAYKVIEVVAAHANSNNGGGN